MNQSSHNNLRSRIDKEVTELEQHIICLDADSVALPSDLKKDQRGARLPMAGDRQWFCLHFSPGMDFQSAKNDKLVLLGVVHL